MYATFQCRVSLVDEVAKESLTQTIYLQRKKDVEHVTFPASNGREDDEEATGDEPITPGLPPASSDRRKWWLDNGPCVFHADVDAYRVGLPARADVADLTSNLLPNPHRPSNPFVPTDEPDIISRDATMHTNGERTENRRSSLVDHRGMEKAGAQGRGIDVRRVERQGTQRRSSAASSAVSAASISRRPPPVPQKPATLVSAGKTPRNRAPSPPSERSLDFASSTSSQVLPSVSTTQRTAALPTRHFTSKPIATGLKQGSNPLLHVIDPAIKANRSTGKLQEKTAPVVNLMDDDDLSGGSIMPLQPHRSR